MAETESAFIARSVEIDSGILITVIIVDACTFLVFSYLTCHLEDTGIGVYCGCTVPPDSKKTKLGSSDQETSPSAVENTGVYLVSPYIYFQWCGCFWGSLV